MKKLIIPALVLLMGAIACNKAEIPEAQAEEPAAAEVQPQMDVKSVAVIIEDAIIKEQAVLVVKDMVFLVREGDDNHHFEFEIGKADPDFPYNYISGTLGITKGLFHPVVIDMDLLLFELVTIEGQLDIAQIQQNHAKAMLALDNITCDYYLAKANDGIALKIMDSYRICYLRNVDENGKRTIGLYLLDPTNPEVAPFPLKNLFRVVYAGVDDEEDEGE